MKILPLTEKKEFKRFKRFRRDLYRKDPYYVSTAEFTLDMLLYRQTDLAASIEICPVMGVEGKKILLEALLIHNPKDSYLQIAFFEALENIPEEDEDIMILYIVIALTVMGVVMVVAVIWRDSRCPNCKKHDIQRVNSRVVGRSNGYITTETTYRCLKCGHIFTRQTTSFDNNYRGPRGGVIVTGGGFGGGRGFGGGSFGGGSFGGGGAGSRF